jgi:phage baseplate assembly protein V
MTVRFGVVEATDPARGRVRVRLPGEDGVLSPWLFVTSPATGRNRMFHMPDVGEHVSCLLDERSEAGVILGAIYSQPEPPPVSSQDKTHIAWDDGAWIEYDRATHELRAFIPGKVDLAAKGDVSIIAEGAINAKAKGALTLSSDVAINLITPALSMSGPDGSMAAATLKGNFGLQGSLTATGDIAASGTVMDAGGNSNHHSH